MDFFKSAWSWFTGSSITASLAKTAILGYVSRLLSGSTDAGAGGVTQQPDKGARLQLNPSTDNQIPVLYGSAYFGGNITDAVLSSDYKTMTYCLTLAETTGSLYSTSSATGYTFNKVYLNNNRVVFKADGITVDYTVDSSGNQDVSFQDLVKIYFYAGTGIQPTGSSGTTPASYTVMPGWNSTDYPMTGLVYAIVQVTYSRDKGVTGLPDCLFHVTTTMTKPGDVIYDYLTNTRYGAGISSSDINTTSITALNSYATTGFTYTPIAGGSATGQIKINGVIDTTQNILDNLNEMAKAASSWLNYDIHTGKWNVVINKTGTSVASFDDSSIIGDIAISGTSLLQLANAANVEYQNTDILDKTDFVKIEIPSEDRYQNEVDYQIDIKLPYTNNQVVATKIGLQALKQARVDKIITFTTDYSYLNITAGSLIDVTSTVYGFTNKVFRVITATEIYGDDDTIQIQFKCLEYDSAVYDYDITEYAVTTDAGIIAIGSIGKPNTPTVTKVEQDNVPRIIISAEVPSGVVDAVEYWITFDTSVASDSARTYIKIGEYKNTNGSALTEDDIVNYTYSGLQQSDFYVKVRGVNNLATGPYSDPSGLVEYVPVVVADTVSDSPVSVGGTLMGLGLLTLLNNLDKLFGGSTASGGLFDKIFSIFKDETGIDLLGNAKDGSLVVAADVAVKADGEEVSAGLSSLDFTGPLTATGTNDVTVKITDGTKNKDILAWNKDEGEWQTISDCIDCDFTNVPPEAGAATDCSLVKAATLPANNFQGVGALCPTSTTVPYVGSYFIKFNINPGAEGAEPALVSTISTGTEYTIAKAGNTDWSWFGAANNNVGTTFTAKDPAVLWASGKNANEITVGKRYKIKSGGGTGSSQTDFTLIGADNNTPGTEFTATGNSDGSGIVEMAYGTGWVYGEGTAKEAIELVAPLVKGTGNFKLYGTDGSLEQTVSISSCIIHNNVVEIPFANRAPGKDYYIIYDEGIVTNCSCENPAIADADTWTFTTSETPVAAYQLTSISPTNIPDTTTSDVFNRSQMDYSYSPTSQVCSTGQKLILTFSTEVIKGTGSATLKNRATKSTIQTFPASSVTITEVLDETTGLPTSWKVDCGSIPSLTADTEYDFDIPRGFLTTASEVGTSVVCDKTTNTPAPPARQSMAKTWGITAGTALKVTNVEYCTVDNGAAKLRTNIKITFNKPVKTKSGAAEIGIYGGLLGLSFQKIDLNGTYASKKYGTIYDGATSATDNPDTATDEAVNDYVIMVNPTKMFSPNTEYHIEIPSGVLIDASCDEPWAGVSDSTTIAWKTDGAAPTAPEGLTYGSVLFYMEYDRPIDHGYGKMNITTPDGMLLTQISTRDLAVAIKYNESFTYVPPAIPGITRIRPFAALRGMTASMTALVDNVKFAELGTNTEFTTTVAGRRVRYTSVSVSSSVTVNASIVRNVGTMSATELTMTATLRL